MLAADGFGGYGGGLDQKRTLLALEGALLVAWESIRRQTITSLDSSRDSPSAPPLTLARRRASSTTCWRAGSIQDHTDLDALRERLDARRR